MLNISIMKVYDKVLNGTGISYDEAIELSNLKGEDILDLVSLANKVRNRFFGDPHVCTIMNAKSGKCSEDCKFCAQSSFHSTGIEEYPLANKEQILKQAENCYKSGVKHFGLVTSGRGYENTNDEFIEILDAIDLIYDRFPQLNVCASIGILNRERAYELAKKNIKHYNINLQTAPSKYNKLISTTHDIEEKYSTIRYLKEFGVEICAGGIIGLGESMKDRIEMAFKLKELEVEVIPLNVLIPIPGTPLEGIEELSVSEIALSFALFRLINPKIVIKFAAGRETKMKDFQGLLMLAGANGFLTGGYLTTRGREVSEDDKFGDELKGFRN
ncbi:MAG: biotin synthase BioB [Candidatus Delongbacteria bacterium]|nr:biotin synthase BioB [Candidatus Delongbacteria bacterium]MBN2836015.1 biotin synthase BioB [Candidatus Delongbacteria bacterium]